MWNENSSETCLMRDMRNLCVMRCRWRPVQNEIYIETCVKRTPQNHVECEFFRGMRNLCVMRALQLPVRLETLQIPVWNENCLGIYPLFKDVCKIKSASETCMVEQELLRVLSGRGRMRSPQRPTWQIDSSSNAIGGPERDLWSENCVGIWRTLQVCGLRAVLRLRQNMSSLQPCVTKGPVWHRAS